MEIDQNAQHGLDMDRFKEKVIAQDLIAVAEGKKRSFTFPGNNIQTGTMQIKRTTSE